MNCPSCHKEVIPHYIQNYADGGVRKEYYCLKCGWRGHTLNDAIIENLPVPPRLLRLKTQTRRKHGSKEKHFRMVIEKFNKGE